MPSEKNMERARAMCMDELGSTIVTVSAVEKLAAIMDKADRADIADKKILGMVPKKEECGCEYCEDCQRRTRAEMDEEFGGSGLSGKPRIMA